jgi:predicted phosphodiesterase
MKIALINDTHYGIRSDNHHLLDYFARFYKDVFFPTLKERGITRVLHLGDLVDRRKYVNFHTAQRMRKDFIDPLVADYETDIIVGNHDVFYKDNNRTNCFNELLEAPRIREKIRTYIDPVEIEIDGCLILLLPWICEENEQRSLEAIKNTKAQVCFGHLALQGFEMDRGSYCQEGDFTYSRDMFEKFEVVGTGHFHQKSSYGNIFYLGAPYEMTWADYGQLRGFHIFDTATRQLEHIKNPYSLFKKFEYNDNGWDIDTVRKQINYKEYAGCYVKVIVKEKTNPFLFDTFIDKLEKVDPADIQVLEDSYNLNIEVDDNFEGVEDTLTLLNSYCAQLPIKDHHRSRLEVLLKNLYNDANSMQ